jgi:predicted amidohydrolase YtcJ
MWCKKSAFSEHLTANFSEKRRKLMLFSGAGSITAAFHASVSAQDLERPDTVFRNGSIYTMSGNAKKVEALAVRDGKIFGAGSVDQVMSLTKNKPVIVNLEGRTVFPGFIDPHNHVVLSSLFDQLLINVGFAQYKTKAQVKSFMKTVAAKTPAGQWLAFGFYDNLLQGGDWSMAEINDISASHPIFIFYVNGHVGAANSLAFSKVGIPQNVGMLPGGGYFGRDRDGQLNGLIYNEPALMKFADLAVPKPSPELLEKAVVQYAKQAAASGLTTLHEPGTVKPQWVESLAKLSNYLPIRFSASFSSDAVEESKQYTSLGPSNRARILPNSRFSLYGMKCWADGSNQAESAAQTQPYLHTDKKGTLSYTQIQMTEICKKAKAAGWTMLAHCQGDAAIDEYLNALEAVYGANPTTGLMRVEHATMVRQDQLERIKKLGYELTFMTDFVYLYGAAYRDSIFGPERAEFMVPCAAAHKAGLQYSVHSDNPAAGMPLNPLRHVQIQLMRQCIADGSVVGPAQRVDLDTALRAVTINPSRHIGMEHMLGSLEKGKEADLTILEKDPFATDAGAISGIKVSETWVAGQKAFG